MRRISPLDSSGFSCPVISGLLVPWAAPCGPLLRAKTGAFVQFMHSRVLSCSFRSRRPLSTCTIYRTSCDSTLDPCSIPFLPSSHAAWRCVTLPMSHPVFWPSFLELCGALRSFSHFLPFSCRHAPLTGQPYPSAYCLLSCRPPPARHHYHLRNRGFVAGCTKALVRFALGGHDALHAPGWAPRSSRCSRPLLSIVIHRNLLSVLFVPRALFVA